MIPVEVLPVDPALTTGAVWLRYARIGQPQIALQPARVAGGIAVGGSGRSRVYVLALLGEVERNADGTLKLDVASDRRAWCELATLGRPFVDCFQDLDEDGTLDTVRQGALGNPEPLSLNRVGEPTPSDPVAYHAAPINDLPQYQIGYESCRSQTGATISADSELRYSTIVRRTDQRRLVDSPSYCNDIGKLVEARDDGDSVVQFGRFKVLLHPQGEEIVTTLLEGIAAGTFLGGLRMDRPLTDATEVATRTAERAPQRPSLFLVAAPTHVATEVSAGEHIFVAEVAHGITGTLAVEAKAGGWGNKATIPAGTPLFGAAMSSGGVTGFFDPEIVWCAPQRDDWTSLCFAGAVLARNPLPYVVESLVLSSSDGGVLAPVVTRGPVDFGAPLLLTLRFDGVDRRGNALLTWSVAPAEALIWVRIPQTRNGEQAALLTIADAQLEVTPTQDGTRATVRQRGEFRSGADARPQPLVR
jgi:hypothetical protein